MKKATILFLIIFFITGCGNNADYTLEIMPDTIKETTTITLKENDYNKANYLNDVFFISESNYNNEKESGSLIIQEIKTKDLNATYNSEDIFDKKIDNDKITLKFNYKKDTYETAKIFNSCFNKTYYDSTEEYYVIKGYDQFKCLYKDEIKIVINTKYKVIDSNADEIKQNKYIWYFNEENYLDHELHIQVSKQLKKKTGGNWKMYVLIVMGIIYIIYKILTKANPFFIGKNNEV